MEQLSEKNVKLKESSLYLISMQQDLFLYEG